MDTSSAHAGNDRFVGNVDFDNVIDSDTGFFHRFGLPDRAWKSIEKIAFFTIRLFQTILDEIDNQFIGNQTTGFHDFFRFETKRRTCSDSCTQHVAG